MAVHCRRGSLDREARLQPRVAADVHGLLAELLHAAGDHVLDLGSIDAGAVNELGVGLGKQVGRVDVLEVALLRVPAPDRRADGLDNHDLAALEVPVLHLVRLRLGFNAGLCSYGCGA